MWSVLIFLTFLIYTTNSAKKDPPVYHLPSYIKRACSRNDPNLNQCVTEVGAAAIKLVAKGDAKYKIPTLDPMLIKELRVKQGTKQVGLELVCRDCKIWGLQHTLLKKTDINWKKRSCRWDLTLDKLKITGKYNITGQVLLLPIVGDGDVEMNLEDLTFTYDYDWTYEKKKNGFTYVIIDNSSFPFDVRHMTMKLDNLFNGDPLLGGNMNRFLNEHWEEILKDLKPALSDAFSKLITTVLQNMAKVVPYDYMYPDTKR